MSFGFKQTCNFSSVERASHPSAVQVEALVSFLESKPSLAKGLAKTSNAKEQMQKDWGRVAVQLNSMGGGANKSAKKWMKVR